MDLNSVTISGNLTRDPELRQVGANGTTVCDLRVAVNAREKQGGEWIDRPNYFDVAVWGKQGENAANFLEKGRPVAVTGELRWREWTAEDDTKRQAVSITAEKVKFLSNGNANGKSGGQGYANGQGQQPAVAAQPAGQQPAAQAQQPATTGPHQPLAQQQAQAPQPVAAGATGGGGEDDLPF